MESVRLFPMGYLERFRILLTYSLNYIPVGKNYILDYFIDLNYAL